jgi:hypothetical protein
MLTGCSGISTKESKEIKKDSTELVGIYYFHAKNRCKTCIAVGEVTKNTLTKYFAGKKEVVLHEINLDDKNNKSTAEEFQVQGSSLIMKYKIKSDIFKENLTELAFLNALTNPDTIEGVLKIKIENILKENGIN